MAITFRTGRKVILRPLEKSDASLLATWMNDPDVTQYLTRVFPISTQEEEEWVMSLPTRQRTNIVLGIETHAHELIGTIGLHGISWTDRRATTGTVIGECSYRNGGFGTDAKMLLLEYAFNTLGLRKVCSDILASNARSIRYGEKCGYHVEGVLKAHHYRNGEYHDEVRMAVFREEWLAAWQAYQRNVEVPQT